MRKKIKLIWQFICKASSGITSKPKQPRSLVCLTGRLYDSASLLTLDRFIKCACDNDLSQLKINPSDSIPELSLKQTWEAIYEQFIDGVQDAEGIQKTKLNGKINHMVFTYELIQLSAKFLAQAYHPEVIERLRRHIRVTGNFNFDNREEYFHDIQIILNRAQGIQADIENKKIEYKMLMAGGKVNLKTTQRQFDQLIAQVSIYAKFHIDKKIVTVSEFIEYYTSRRESFEALEEQYQQAKNKR